MVYWRHSPIQVPVGEAKRVRQSDGFREELLAQALDRQAQRTRRVLQHRAFLSWTKDPEGEEIGQPSFYSSE